MEWSAKTTKGETEENTQVSLRGSLGGGGAGGGSTKGYDWLTLRHQQQ